MKFWPELLSLLHDDSHLGVDKCVQRAKGCVYWLNISEDIKSIVHKSEKCLMNCRHNQKEPNIPIEIPIIAWKLIATHLFVFNDKIYILVVDLFSWFPVIRRLASESTCLVLEAIKNIFSDFGIPEAIISDNGPCYKSQEFNQFCDKFEIRHIPGSAYNHQANAIAERSIQLTKNSNDQWLALLIFKLTPITDIDKSPSELLCNRKFRRNLPLVQHASELASKAKLHNNDDKYNTGKELLPIPTGSQIVYGINPDHNTKRPEWSKGTVRDVVQHVNTQFRMMILVEFYQGQEGI